MKRTSTLLTLFLLLASFVSIQAVTYTVNQNFAYVAPKQCFGANTPSYNGQDLVDLVTVNVEVDHNINGYPVGSPYLPSTINQQCWRYIYFDIYKHNNGVETFEATITKYHYWLNGAAYTNGSSTTPYTLSVSDLNNAGISGGEKIVRMRVRYDYFGNTPHTLNLNVTKWNQPLCSQNNIDNSANSPLDCTVGLVDCFTYQPCNASITVNGYVSLVPIYDRYGNIVGYSQQYTYPAYVSGGSGSYTYSWYNTETGATSSSSSFTFTYNGNKPHVYLAVTDNVTGCVYYWSTQGKTSFEAEAEALTFDISPNPATSYSTLHINYTMPSPDLINFELYDLSGKKIRELGHGVSGYIGENTFEASTQGIPAGIYLVRMVSEGNGVSTQKLIVQ